MILFRVLCTAIVICAINQSSTGRSLERTKRDAEEDKEQDTQSYTEDAEGTTEETPIDRRFITMNQDNHFDMVVQKSHDFSAHYDNEDETSSESIHENNNDINELLSKLQSNMAFNKDATYPSGMHFSNANDMQSSNLQDMLQSMMNQNGGQLDEQSIKNIMSMMGGGQENADGAQFSFQHPAGFNWENMAGSGGNTASLDVDSIIQMLAQQYNVGAEQKELLKSQMKHMDSEQLQQLLNMVTMFGDGQGQVTMHDGDVAPQFDGSQITMSQDEMAGLLKMLKERGYSQDSPNAPIQIEQSQLEELLKMIKMKANGGDGRWNTEQTKDVKHQIDIQVSDESTENTDDGNMDMEQLMKLIMSLQGGGEKTSQLNIDPRILQMLMKISAGLPKSPAGLPKEMAVNLNPDLLKYLMHMLQNKPKQKHPVEEPRDVGGDEMNKILQLLQSGKPKYKKPMQAGVEPASGNPSHDDLLKLLQMFGPKTKEQDKVIQIRLPGYDKPAPVEIDWDNILNMIQKNPQILGGLQSMPQKGELPDWLLNLIKNMKKKPSGSKPQHEIGPQDNEEHDETDTNLPDQMPNLADILKLFNKPKKPNSKQPSYNKDENLPDTNGEENQPDLSDIWKLLKSFGTTPAPSSKYPNNMPSSGKKHRHPSHPDQPEDNDANLPVSNKTPGLSSLLKDLFNFASDNDKNTTPRPRPNNWPKPGPGSVPFRPDNDQPQYPNPEEDEENLPMGHSPDNSSGGYSYGSQESTNDDEDDENLPLQHPPENLPSNDPYGPQYPWKTTTEKSLLSKILDFLNPPEDPEENDENLPMDHTVDKRPYEPRYPQETTTNRPSLSKIFIKFLKPKDGSDEDDVNLPMTQSTEHPDKARPMYPVESKTQPNLTNLILTLLNPTYNPEEEATKESVDDWHPGTTKKPSLSDIFALFNPDKKKQPNNRPGYRPNYHPSLTHDPISPDFFNPLDIYSPEGEGPEDNGDYQRVHQKTTTTHVIKIINITGEQPVKTNRPRFPERGVYIPNNNSPLEDKPEEPDVDGNNNNNNILKQIFNNLNLDRFNRTRPPSLKPTQRPYPIRPSIPFHPPSKAPGTSNLLNTIMQYLIDKNKYEIDDSPTKKPIILPIPTIVPERNPLDKEKIAAYPNLDPPNRPRDIDVYFPYYKDPTIIAPYETEAIDDEGRPVSPEWLPLIDKAVYLANKFFPNKVADVIFMPESSNNNVGFLPSLSELIKSSVSGDSSKPDEPKDPKRDTLLKRLFKTIFSSSLPSTDTPRYPEEEPFLTRFVKNLVKASFPEYVRPTYPPTRHSDSTKPSLLFDRNITNPQHLDSPLDVLLDFLKLASDPEGSDPLRDKERPRKPSLVRIILSILRSNSPVEDYPSKPSPLWPFDPKRPSEYQLSLTKTIINLLRSEFSTTDPLEYSPLFPKPWSPSHSKPKDESILYHLLPLFDSSVPSRDRNKHPFLPGDPEDLLEPSRTRKPFILNYLLPLFDSSIPSADRNKYPFPKDSPFDELFNSDKKRPSLLKSVMNMLLKSSDPNYPSDSSSDWPDLWHPRPRPNKEPNDRHKSILYYILLLLQSNLKPLEEEILNHIKKPLSPWDPFDSFNDLWPEKWSPKLIPDTALPMWERFTQLASFAPTALTGLLSMLYSGSPSIDSWTDTPNKPNSGGIIPSLGSSYDPEDTNRPSISDDHTPGTKPREKPSNWMKEITSTSSSLGERPSKIKRPSGLIEHFLWPLNISYPTRDPSKLKPRNELLSILDSSTPLGSKQNNRPSSWFADPNKSPKDRPRTTLDYLLPFFDSSTPSSMFDDSPSDGKKSESIPSRFIKAILSFSILQSVHIPGSTTRTPDSNDLDSLIWYIMPNGLKKLFDISTLPDSSNSPSKRPDTLSKRPSLTREILSILRSDSSDDPSTSNTPQLGKKDGPLRYFWRSIKDVSNYLFSNPTKEPKDKHPHPIIDLLKPKDSILKRILNLLRYSDPEYPSKQAGQPKDPFDIFNWPRDKPDGIPFRDRERYPLLKKPSLFKGILSILLSKPEPSSWLDPLSPSNQRPDSKSKHRTRPSLMDDILSFLGSNPNRDDPIFIPSRDKPGYIPSRDRKRYPLLKRPSLFRSILSILRSDPEPGNWLDPLSPSNQRPDSKPTDRTRLSLTDEILSFLGSNPNRDDPISIPSRDKERYPLLPKYDPDLPKYKDSILKRILNLLRSRDPDYPSKQGWQPKDPFDIFNWPRDKPDGIPFRDKERNPLLPKYDSRNKKRPSLFGVILSILISNPEPSNWLDPLSPSNQRPDSKTDRTRSSLTDEILSFLGSNPNRDDPISIPSRDKPGNIPSRDRERYPLLPKYSILKRILNLLGSNGPESPSKQEEQPTDPFDIFNWPGDKPGNIPSTDRKRYPLLPKYDPHASKNKKRPSFIRSILSILLSNSEPSKWLDPLIPSNKRPDSRPSLTDEILSFLGSNPNRNDPVSKPSLEHTLSFPNTNRRSSLFKDILKAFDSSRILTDDLLPGRDKKYPDSKPSLESTLSFPSTKRRPSIFKDILKAFDSSRLLPDDLLPGRDKKYPDSKPSLSTLLDFPKREKKPSLLGDILSLFDSSKPLADKDRRPSIISDILTSLHSNPKRDTPLFPSSDFSWLPKWLRPMKGDKLYGQITFDKISEICNKLLNMKLVTSVIPSAITNIFGPLDDNFDPFQALKILLKPSPSATEKKEFPSIFPSWHELFAVSVGDKSEIDLFKPKPENNLFPSKSDAVGTSKNPFKELKDLFKLPDPEESKKSFSLSGTVLKFLTRLTTDPWSLKDDDDIKRDSRLISLIQKISNLNISDRQKIYDCLKLKTMLPTLIARETEEIHCDLVKLLMKLKFPKLSEGEINNLIAQQVSNHLQSMTNRR